jgi:hypothetical protein
MVRAGSHPPEIPPGLVLCVGLLFLGAGPSSAAGIDHLAGYDNSGIWKRSNQQVTAIVTPFVLEYGHDHPAVYALELLPAYDAIAGVKIHAHWQTDVLAGFALGTGTGYLAHTRDSPVILGVLPHGFTVGIHAQF